MRVLDARKVTTREELQVVSHDGYRRLFYGSHLLADDSPESHARAAQVAIESQPGGKTVAWIGGGFCVGPRLFAISGCSQSVFEIEPSLSEFCPEGIQFVPGNYRDTFYGTYDVIIYDLGGEVPRDLLSTHLNAGGMILPSKE